MSIVTSTELPTACNDLEDGVQWIRPIAGYQENGEEYPNIQVQCSEGWTILDYSLDSDISQYFSSFTSWTEYAASSSLDDRVTWPEWFKPSTSKTKFRVSADCLTCTTTKKDNHAYFMTGNYIGCLWVTKGMCDMDTSTFECYECDANGNTYSGLCTHMELAITTDVYTEHDLCTTNNYNVIPSIGTNGQFCVCYKPEKASTVDAALSFEKDNSDTVEELVSSPDTEYDLYSEDFKQGTYRITKPGYYKLMEDVELNMNAPDNFANPNAEGAWYPTDTQSDNYEGCDDSFVGAYSMGFFAGFAIESDDVTIDLNGYELKMGKEFHLQQRWFSIIEIGSKAFISGQGPGNFGAFLTSSNNIVIKNGILGLTSHHGIHGNDASGITIQDLVIKDFEVAGIALNGFSDLLIENVEIGPSYKDVPVLGVYTQARIMLPRLRKVINDNPDGKITIHGHTTEDRVLSMVDVEENLLNQMDAVFAYVIEGKEFDDNDEVWKAAKELFINENKIPSASTVYGIFLNSEGASVFAVGGAPGYSYNAIIKNVKIHGLINDPWEVPRLMNVKGPFNDIVDVTRVTDNKMKHLPSSKYIGSAYTDAQFALHELSSSWSILSHSALTDEVVSWISQGQSLADSTSMQCNNDIMLHVTKGIFGLRIDSVEGFEIDNVEIEDLQNIGYYGSWVCGHYSSEDDGGHRNQRAPMQYGYTGTEIHGVSIINSKGIIDNLSVSKVISARGDAAGLRLFPGNQLQLGTIVVSDIHAGAYAKSDDLLLGDESYLPNKLPRGCGIDLWSYSDESDDTLTENDLTYDQSKITVSCVTYMTECEWNYSSELATSIQQCSKQNGNLFDVEDISNSDTIYHIIEETNGGSYFGIISKLQAQDEDNEYGTSLIPEIEAETDANKKSFSVPLWVFIIIAFLGTIIVCIVIYRKCLKSKKPTIELNNPHHVNIRNYNTMNTENVPLVSQQL